MIYLLAHDLEQKLRDHSLQIGHFPNFQFWQERFEQLLNVGYLQAATSPIPTKFAISGFLVHQICQEAGLEESDLLDIAQLPPDYLAKVRLGQIRMAHNHISAFADGAFSYLEDRGEYQTACLLFFMSYRQGMLLDLEREMLKEYGIPIEQVLRETTGWLSSKREQKKILRRTVKNAGSPQSPCTTEP